MKTTTKTIAVILSLAIIISLAGITITTHNHVQHNVNALQKINTQHALKSIINITPMIKIWVNNKNIYYGDDPPTKNLMNVFKIIFATNTPSSTSVTTLSGTTITITNSRSWSSPSVNFAFFGAGENRLFIELGNGTQQSDIFNAHRLSSPVSGLVPTYISVQQYTNGNFTITITGTWISTINTTLTEAGLIMAVTTGALTSVSIHDILILYTPINITIYENDNITISFQISVNNIGAYSNFANLLALLFAPYGGYAKSLKDINGNTFTGSINRGVTNGYDTVFASSSIPNAVVYISNSYSGFNVNGYTLTNPIDSRRVTVYTISSQNTHKLILVCDFPNINNYVYEIGLSIVVTGTDTNEHRIMLFKYVLPHPVYVGNNATLSVSIVFNFNG